LLRYRQKYRQIFTLLSSLTSPHIVSHSARHHVYRASLHSLGQIDLGPYGEAVYVCYQLRLCKNSKPIVRCRPLIPQNSRYGIFSRSEMAERPMKTRGSRAFTQPKQLFGGIHSNLRRAFRAKIFPLAQHCWGLVYLPVMIGQPRREKVRKNILIREIY
jgi:hypothetical protein